MIWFLLLVAIAGLAIWYMKMKKDDKWAYEQDQWLSSAKYKHLWEGYGIAVDVEGKQVHLRGFCKGEPIERAYPFSDVRSWRYCISNTNVTTTATGLAAVSALGDTLSAVRNDAKETGLFIRVKDIDVPEWKIGFKRSSDLEIVLQQWMETLEQTINVDVPASSTAQKALM